MSGVGSDRRGLVIKFYASYSGEFESLVNFVSLEDSTDASVVFLVDSLVAEDDTRKVTFLVAVLARG